MKAYSQFDLIREEMMKLDGLPFTLFDRIFKTNVVRLSLWIPNSLFFRAGVLCEDISELSGSRFDQTNLLSILFDEYLNYIRKQSNLHVVYNNLMSRSQSFPLIIENKNEYVEEGPKSTKLFFPLKRKDALRGETLLADLEEVYPSHSFTLESLLEIIYCDFIVQYRRGNLKDTIHKLLRYIDD